jgi:hypothetical protein
MHQKEATAPSPELVKSAAKLVDIKFKKWIQLRNLALLIHWNLWWVALGVELHHTLHQLLNSGVQAPNRPYSRFFLESHMLLNTRTLTRSFYLSHLLTICRGVLLLYIGKILGWASGFSSQEGSLLVLNWGLDITASFRCCKTPASGAIENWSSNICHLLFAWLLLGVEHCTLRVLTVCRSSFGMCVGVLKHFMWLVTWGVLPQSHLDLWHFTAALLCEGRKRLRASPLLSEASQLWWINLVDPASSHMLVSKIKPCMSQYKLLHGETANGSLKQL